MAVLKNKIRQYQAVLLLLWSGSYNCRVFFLTQSVWCIVVLNQSLWTAIDQNVASPRHKGKQKVTASHGPIGDIFQQNKCDDLQKSYFDSGIYPAIAKSGNLGMVMGRVWIDLT